MLPALSLRNSGQLIPPKDKETVTTESVCAAPLLVGSTKTRQGENMSREVSSEISSTSTINDQQLDKQAPGRRAILDS